MAIQVFGTLAVDGGTTTLSRRDRIVLAALATRPGRVLSRDQLADALWGDFPPASSSKVLQGCVVRIRKTIGQEAIRTAPAGYRLAVVPDDLDVGRFEQLVARAHELLALDQPDRAAYAAEEALALWRGRPFADLEGWEPAMSEEARLRELRLSVEELHLEASLQSGRHAEVQGEAAALVHRERLRERRWALLARAQYQDGRQGDALRTLGEARAVLRERLGVDPGEELTDLEAAILRQDEGLDPPERSAPSLQTCPYRGLAAFGVDDRDDFYGREPDLAICRSLLEARGALAVVGPSGFGKSSLVRAGVAASLIRDGLRVQVMTPGLRPLETLEGVLSGPRHDVLVVDQAEEVFAPTVEAAERREFVCRLIAQGERTQLVLALRADHMGNLAEVPDLARMVESCLHLVSELDEDALRRVIEEPARQYGLLLEPGLVDLLVSEVRGAPGALPLLSHALRETWRSREGITLTVAGYQATGGIRGAVAQTAERLFETLAPDDRVRLRTVLLRLITPGPGGEPMRVRVPRRHLGGGSEVDDLVDRLVDARLVTSEDGVVEIAHEALARAWPRLRGWLHEDVDGQRILHHLTGASETWHSSGRPDSELYRGARLAQVLEWQSRVEPNLTDVEREFVEASRASAESAQAEIAERARRQAGLIRRLRLSLVAGTVLLVLALVAGAVALRQSDSARRGEAAAERAERLAEAERLGALGATLGDPVLALLLAVEGVDMADTPETRSYLRAALSSRPALVSTLESGSGSLGGVEVSPDGRTVAAYGLDNLIWLFDTASGDRIGSYDLDGPGASRLSQFPSARLTFSPDGDTLAVGSQYWTTPSLHLLDVPGLRPRPVQLAGVPKRPAKVVDVDYSGDGRHLAVSYVYLQQGAPVSPSADAGNGEVRVWDLQRPTAGPAVIRLEEPPAWDRVKLSPDGRVLYTGGPPRAFAVATGELLWRRDTPPTGGGPIALSSTGELLATPHVTGVVVRDARTGDQVRRLASGSEALAVAISADDRMIAASLDDSTVRVWDLHDGRPRATFSPGGFGAVSMSPDGSVVYFVDAASGVQVWDVDGSRRFVTRQGLTLPSSAQGDPTLTLSPDGELLAARVDNDDGPAGGGTSDLVIVDAATSEHLRTVTAGGAGVLAPGAWHPSGKEFAVADLSGTITVVPVEGPVRRGVVTRSEIVDLDYTRDGEKMAVLDREGRVITVDSQDLSRVGRPTSVPGEPAAIAASADGRSAVVLAGSPVIGPGEFSSSMSWRLVDLQSHDPGRARQAPHGSIDQFSDVALSPDGSRVALVGASGAWFLEAVTGRLVAVPVPVHRSTVSGRFSEDGSAFVSSGDRGVTALWDPETGNLVDRVVTEPDVALDAAFLGATKTLRIASPSGFYRADMALGPALEAACRAAGRSMTRAEWGLYVGDRPYRQTCS